METMEQTTGTTRRQFVRTMMGVGATAVAGAAFLGTSLRADAQDVSAAVYGYFLTTSSLNLRAQPSSSAAIILVMPSGAAVQAIGPEQNGFLKVAYKGYQGWASKTYLRPTNGGSTDQPIPSTGIGYTASSVNFRSGPSTAHAVIAVLPAGTRLDLYDSWYENFRLVGWNGTKGYVANDYIRTDAVGPAPATMVTTASVNFRTQPSTTSSVIQVLPKGTSVRVTDELSNGFRKVSYGGKTGWVATAYLA